MVTPRATRVQKTSEVDMLVQTHSSRPPSALRAIPRFAPLFVLVLFLLPLFAPPAAAAAAAAAPAKKTPAAPPANLLPGFRAGIDNEQPRC